MAEDSPTGVEEIVPSVREHLLPLIHASVDTCLRTYGLDEFSDNYVFGSQLWRLVWNRCLALAGEEGSPVSYSGDSRDFSIRIQGVKIEPHPVRFDTRLPNNAKAIKDRLDAVQLTLFAAYDEEGVWLPNSLVLAIAATPEDGLHEVFLGVLQKNGFTSQFEWRDVVPVYQRLTSGMDVPTTGTTPRAGQVDVEPEFEPDVAVYPTKCRQAPSQAEDNR